MNRSVNERLQSTTIVILSIVFLGFANGWCLEVSDTLQGGEWTLADSPVMVVNHIVLPPGVSLMIEAGVRVEFTGPYQFVINGLLEAVGTSDAEVVFTAFDPAADSLRWGGLRYVNAERGCRLLFCKIQYGWARGSWPNNNGGGIYIESSSIEIVGSEISHNRADGNGGGVYGWFTQSIFNNSLIVENYSGSMGGGMFIAYASPLLNNCTIAFDTCLVWGGGLFIGAEGKPTISNCIIVSNFNEVDGDIPPGDDYFHDLARAKSSAPVVSFSCIRIIGEDAFGGAGNIVGNPLFLNPPVGTEDEPFVPPADYHLDYSSPCIDAGDPSMGAGLEDDNRLNMGTYGGTETSTPSVPVITIIPKSKLSYGSVRINTQTSNEVTVVNFGHAHLQIDNIIFEQAVFFPDSAKRDDGVLVPAYKVAPIAPGERLKFSIQYLPVALRKDSSLAIFITNDTVATSNNPELILVGTGIDPIAELVDLVEFGEVQIGSHAELTFELRNTGRSTLIIDSPTIQGDFFDIDIDSNILEPGASTEVVFSFDPEFPGGTEALARIPTNDRDLGVSLLGVGTGPKMVVDTDSLYLGFVYFDGDTVNYDIPISNEGDDVLNILDARVSTAAFSTILPTEGISIAPEQSGKISIRFHPPQADVLFEDVLTILSNYPINHTIGLYGQGMPEPGRYVFGEVSGTWRVDPDNPEDFIVLDSVVVPAHETLSIGPGVRILFEPGGTIKAEGTLRAVGTMTDSIYFLPRDPLDTDEARWGGVELALEDASRMVYCVIRNTIDGLKIRESSPLIQFCSISNNGMEEILNGNEGEPPELFNIGGGISLENSGTLISACTIEDNVGSYGGGILVLNSKPVINNCLIRRNRAVVGGAMGLIFQASALIRSNLIYDNSAVIMCGGISVMNQSAPQIINNSIIANTGCGVYSLSVSIPVIINSVVWDNEALQDNFNSALEIAADANALVSYSDIEGGFNGTGNLDIDPEFIDGAGGDYHLSDASPLIDMGNQEPEHRDYSFPPSLGSEINDIGAFGGPLGGSWDAPALSISVFQNPAFPHWLDITLTSLDQFAIPPSCSLGIEGLPRQKLELTALDDQLYYGTYEARENGTLFLTVDTQKNDGSRLKTGRTYELFFLGADLLTSIVPLSGTSGQLEIQEGSLRRDSYILSGTIQQPVQPTDKRLYLSTPFFIHGIVGKIDPPALLKIEFNPTDWSEKELSKLNLYRLEGNNYIRLDGGYADGKVCAEMDRGGTFILGWGEDVNPLNGEQRPQSFALLGAYPNPFNQSTILEMDIKYSGYVSLDIYNLRGQKIISLQGQHLEAGSHRSTWNGDDEHGMALPSGLYLAHATAPGQINVVKLLLLR